MTFSDLNQAFGISKECEEQEALREAFTALVAEDQESGTPTFHSDTVREGLSIAESLEALNGADIPEWSAVSHILENPTRLNQEIIAQLLEQSNKEEPILEDQDDYGAYVALEAYYPEYKMVEGLTRMPLQGEQQTGTSGVQVWCKLAPNLHQTCTTIMFFSKKTSENFKKNIYLSFVAMIMYAKMFF